MVYVLLGAIAWQNAGAATFATNALITEANTSFDGHDIVVNGATLTVDGRHFFNSLLLPNGAVLTHSHCTTTNNHKLELVVTSKIVVSIDSLRSKRAIQDMTEIGGHR